MSYEAMNCDAGWLTDGCFVSDVESSVCKQASVDFNHFISQCSGIPP